MAHSPVRDIDYAALFAATPSPCLVLSPELVIKDVNQAYLEVTGRERDELLERPLVEVFPQNPSDPSSTGFRNIQASIMRAFATGERDVLMPQKYDIPVAGEPGVFEERYWSPINTPILGPDGRPVLVIHRVEDVTAMIRSERHERGRDEDLTAYPYERRQEMEAELYARTKELQVLHERLRRAHAHEREAAVAFQRAVLPPVSSLRRPDTAVRYRPAAGWPNACGDWYELVDLANGRRAVAVGDVVGHGLRAAGMMAQLRGALGAAIRTADGPAAALEVLCAYAGPIEGALGTTVVQTVIDTVAHTIDYSSAGHPPPVLLRPNGAIVLLDQATDPPLGARPGPGGRTGGRVEYASGSTLVLYTDGLIERRGEDIDVGLQRLTAALVRNRSLDPEPLADVLLSELGICAATADDTALVVVRL